MKTVLITGAASGIGAATARLFADKGWRLVLLDVNTEALAKLADSLPVEPLTVTADVRSQEQIDAAMAQVSDTLGGSLDLLINNAGVLRGGDFMEQGSEDDALMIDINITGFTRVARAGFPLLKRARGTMVNLCSVSSVHGIPGLAVYSASKHYVNGFTEALNIEWADHGIKVNSVKPPFVRTAMLGHVPPGMMERLGVELVPEDIAKSIWNASQGSKTSYLISAKAKLMAFICDQMPSFASRRFIHWLCR